MLIPILFSPRFPGYGYIAGEPPPSPNPLELDGRAYVQGATARLRITVYDGSADPLVALHQTWSQPDGTWHIGPLPLALERLVVIFWNDGQYTVEIGGQMLPVNSFVQDFVRAQPYADDPPEP